MIEDYKHFFIGYPANYALVGIHDRRIWLVIPDEEMAHRLREVFSSKLALVVVNLKSFKNYSENQVDNTVCLNWEVPRDEFLKGKITKNIDTPIYNTTYNATGEIELSNTNTYEQIGLLTLEQQQDLQCQMMLYAFLYPRIFHGNVQYPAFSLELVETELDTKSKERFNRAFGFGLILPDVEEEIFQAALDIVETSPSGTLRYAWGCSILQMYNKLYG